MIPGAFCNKNYKFIRVAADSISRLCLAVFYQIISYCYKIVGSPTAHHYESLALYQSGKAKNLFTYLRFGKEIIDFCVNAPQQIKSPSSIHHVSEDQTLRSMYGDEDIDKWIEIITKDASPKLEELCSLKITDGCCLGMSLDFISHYLLNVNSKKPLGSFFDRYQEGAPKEAQLAQIFYRTLHSTKSLTEEKRERIAIENHALGATELGTIENLIKRASDEKSKNYFISLKSDQMKRVSTEGSKDIVKMVLDRNLIMTKPFKFTMDIDNAIIFVPQEIEELQDLEFELIIDDLSAGIYYVSSTSGNSGHSMAYIKTEEGKHIIYDPNLAILAVNYNEAGARLWKIVKRYIKEDENFTVSFSPCSLFSKKTSELLNKIY
ncbi:MAG TPA: hypothetical protein VGZ69_06305 [Candidatus Rhabdochlamydia sp.]|jgi:hypothetical protein|nr:hypothetical protein [Candidatus Rhabdochlamydia sp.]